MTLAILNSCALSGLSAPDVAVETHLSTGLPAFHIVGIPDTGVRESKERVRAAIENAGFEFPSGRYTVNLSPCDLPKESGRFDLPIALGVLLATGQLRLNQQQLQALRHVYIMGELSLTGTLLSIKAPLIIARDIVKRNPKAILLLPQADAEQAACVSGLTVIGVRHLKEAVDFLSGQLQIQATQATPLLATPQHTLCLSDIRGQPYACQLLEIAASGGHGLLLSGSPGVGKSMLAQRLPTLLPTLSTAQSLDVIALYSLSSAVAPPIGQAPFRAPHHSSSMVAMVGGSAQPGEISLAHHGVLFLDELPEFERRTLEALREPLENGEIHISRAKKQQTYPARFQLIAAYNPCPCGYLGHPNKPCRCSPDKIQRYQQKLSGPLLDRIDMHLPLQDMGDSWLQAKPAEKSSVVRERVAACRARQITRQGVLNAHLTPSQLKTVARLNEAGMQQLSQAIQRFAWSTRVATRVLRVARSIADMQNKDSIEAVDLQQAILCRQER